MLGPKKKKKEKTQQSDRFKGETKEPNVLPPMRRSLSSSQPGGERKPQPRGVSFVSLTGPRTRGSQWPEVAYQGADVRSSAVFASRAHGEKQSLGLACKPV